MNPPAHTPVRVFVYFDYVCPYSYLALHLLEAVHAEHPVGVVWRPLETRPDIGLESEAREGIAARPADEDTAGTDWDELAERAAALGIPLYRPATVPATRLALQAAQFARDLGSEAHRRLHRAIFRAHFVRRIDIGLRDNLMQLANEEGIDRQALERALDDERYLEELSRAEREAERYEISQTPTMLFGRFKVIGAAPLDVIRDAALRAAAEM